MRITPDTLVYWQWGPAKINATLVFSWAVMALLVLVSWLVGRRLTSEGPGRRAQTVLETVVSLVRDQIAEISGQDPRWYLPFIGTIYLFVATANFLAFLPGYHPPTGSLSTTAAFSALVLLAVPVYSIANRGLRGFLRHYIEPTPLMLPFNVLGELSRTLALAVRLFGNVMSGTLIAAILLLVAPLIFPVLLEALELLIGQVQAYIFAVLSTVYIASAARRRQPQGQPERAEQRRELQQQPTGGD